MFQNLVTAKIRSQILNPIIRVGNCLLEHVTIVLKAWAIRSCTPDHRVKAVLDLDYSKRQKGTFIRSGGGVHHNHQSSYYKEGGNLTAKRNSSSKLLSEEPIVSSQGGWGLIKKVIKKKKHWKSRAQECQKSTFSKCRKDLWLVIPYQ